MPIALDANETFDLWLESDAAKPEETRPKFIFRYQTWRQYRESVAIARARERLLASGDDAGYAERSAESEAAILAVLSRQLAGWRNLPLPFSPDAIQDVVIFGEAVELFHGALRQWKLPVPEKNASGSPSPSDSGKSAPANAPVATAAA